MGKEYMAKIGVVGAQRRRRMWRRKAGLEEDIHLVNEDYTSMLCSSCHERLEPMFDEEGRAIHAVRRCHNSECNRMVWHRDVNACLNIMWVFIREQLDGFRPPVFTRAFQQQQQHVF